MSDVCTLIKANIGMLIAGAGLEVYLMPQRYYRHTLENKGEEIMEENKWNSFWKSHPDSKYTFTTYCRYLNTQTWLDRAPCYVIVWKEKV
jgi:hypothetical protein